MTSESGGGVRPDRGGRGFHDQVDIDGLAAAADRLDDLAATAALMGDDANADRLREQAQTARLRAMRILDRDSDG